MFTAHILWRNWRCRSRRCHLPTLGPLLFVWFGYDIWRRLGVSTMRFPRSLTLSQHAMGCTRLVSDYSCRYRDYSLLQLRAIALSTSVIMEQNSIPLPIACYYSPVYSQFWLWYTANCKHGTTRRPYACFESFVKLFALLCVALFFIHQLTWAKWPLMWIRLFRTLWCPWNFLDSNFAGRFSCLPRQFHVAVVELRDEKQVLVSGSRFISFWLFLRLCKLGFACCTQIPDRTRCGSLPLSYNQEWLALLAFLGQPPQVCYWCRQLHCLSCWFDYACLVAF